VGWDFVAWRQPDPARVALLIAVSDSAVPPVACPRNMRSLAVNALRRAPGPSRSDEAPERDEIGRISALEEVNGCLSS
jgi:hypothetical protein